MIWETCSLAVGQMPFLKKTPVQNFSQNSISRRFFFLVNRNARIYGALHVSLTVHHRKKDLIK